MNSEKQLPPVDALRANDQALLDMQPSLSPEDEAAFKELIDEQRENYQATLVEVKDANTGEQTIHVARSIGDKALHNPGMAVHSESWRTEGH